MEEDLFILTMYSGTKYSQATRHPCAHCVPSPLPPVGMFLLNSAVWLWYLQCSRVLKLFRPSPTIYSFHSQSLTETSEFRLYIWVHFAGRAATLPRDNYIKPKINLLFSNFLNQHILHQTGKKIKTRYFRWEFSILTLWSWAPKLCLQDDIMLFSSANRGKCLFDDNHYMVHCREHTLTLEGGIDTLIKTQNLSAFSIRTLTKVQKLRLPS